jgi:hypothetical protein
MRKKGSLVLYNDLKNNWERERYVEVCGLRREKRHRAVDII